MNEMIEKVAKAIHDAQDPIAFGWHELSAEHQQHLIEQARSAIEAMREPTEMMLARFDEVDGDNAADLKPEYWLKPWQAAVDEALK